MKKTLLSILTIAALGFGVNAQNVNIPDANFKAYLVGNGNINTNGDAEIQVTEATAFTGQINCNSQNISDLTGVEAFTALTQLWCWGNSISALDVSQNTALTSLRCNDNSISTLDVSQNTALVLLGCQQNSLSSIDISQNPSINEFYCHYSPLLSEVNVANGNNANFVAFAANNNPSLTCIQVDDVTYSTTNWTNIDAGASFSLSCSSCTVSIPDANFKAYLVGNTAINTNGDGEIQCTEATAFAGIIDCDGLSISDLTGIEAFTSLDKLFCRGNQLTSIDLSSNTALTRLDCQINDITSLDVSANTAMTDLQCHYNQLTSIDVSTNTALTILNVSENPLTSLNVSTNVNLNYLVCSTTSIGSLDVSSLSSLLSLSTSSTQIGSLDVSGNSLLTILYCYDNDLIASLNAANGNNTNFTQFSSYNNPNLDCIQVDDVAYSTANWTNVLGASFSEDCSGSSSVNEFNSTMINVHPNPASSHITIDLEGEIEAITIFNLSGELVQQENSNSFSILNLANGIYILNVQTNKGLVRSRFVKE